MTKYYINIFNRESFDTKTIKYDNAKDLVKDIKSFLTNKAIHTIEVGEYLRHQPINNRFRIWLVIEQGIVMIDRREGFKIPQALNKLVV